MSVVTQQELELLRTHPQGTKLWLSIYRPSIVLACRVNDAAIALGARSITYDGVSSGSFSLVNSGMTLLVGSAAGKDDKGRIRVKSATSSVLTVAENNHINWADNDFLTVISFYEINAIYPRIIQDPADPLDVIFYKDYDIAYSNQNSVLGSFVCMGPHRAAFREAGQASIYYTASGTSNVKGDALTYSWFFEGATVTGSASQNPGNILYNTPGHYTTRLIVSNASGGTDTSYRHVSIYDRPENGTTNPILKWSLEQFSGSRDKGGYQGRIKIYQDTFEDNVIRDGSLVVIFSDNRFGDTERSIGGNAEGADSIFFVGYIVDGSIEFNYADKMVEFHIGSPSEIMKIAEGFSISVESKTSPATWFELLDMNLKRAIYHYLKWHTTCLFTMDVMFNGTDQNIQYFDADRTSIYDAVSQVIKSALIGSAISDRQGCFYLEVEGYTQGITLPSTFTLDKQDWTGEPEIEDALSDSLSFLEIGGIAYIGGTSFAYLANAPGEAPGYRGKIQRTQGLALSSQGQLNQLAGDIFAWRNSRYSSSRFITAGNLSNLDFAPQEVIGINMFPSDNNRGANFIGRRFRVESLDAIYDSRNESLRQALAFAELTTGTAGTTITIPDVPPTNGSAGGTFNVPPFTVPPLPFPPAQTSSGGIEDIFAFSSQNPLVDVNGFFNIEDVSVDTGNLIGDAGIYTFALRPNSIYWIYLKVSANPGAASTGEINLRARIYVGNPDGTGVNALSDGYTADRHSFANIITAQAALIVDTSQVDSTEVGFVYSLSLTIPGGGGDNISAQGYGFRLA